MKIKSLLITAVLATAILCSGGAVYAADNSALIAQLQAQIQSLMQQIQQIIAQQQGGQIWCHTFNSNLGYANSGTAEVANLQTALHKENISNEPDGPSDYGEGTMHAVIQFQSKYGILQTGYVGVLTRAKLNSLYGCGIAPTTATTQPTISYLSPTSATAGSTVTVYGNGLQQSANSRFFVSITSSELIGTMSLPVVSSSANGTSLTFVVPSNLAAAPYQISVTAQNSVSNLVPFTITSVIANIANLQQQLANLQSATTRCGLTVTTLTPNTRVAFPLIVRGSIDNSQYQTLGCSWTMFEGTAGSAQLYYNYNNEGWKPVGTFASINVGNWTSVSTLFVTTLSFNNIGIGLPSGTPMKIVFTEDNPSGIGTSDSLEIPVILQ